MGHRQAQSPATHGKTYASALLALVLAAVGLAGIAGPASAEPIQDPTRLSTSPDWIWDVDERSGLARHSGAYLTLVWDLQQLNDVMYVGGDFTKVVAPDGTRHSQSFLAAFDLESGEWIPSFAPQLNSLVYSLDVTDDGLLVAGGEFSGGVALIDPATGARVDGFSAGLAHSWGPPAVLSVEVAGDSIYAGGRFVRGQGVTLDNLVKLDAQSGAVDPAWTPSVESVLYNGFMSEQIRDIEVDQVRGRVYVGGLFASINGDVETDSFAVLDPTDGHTLMDHPNVSYDDNRPISFLYDIELTDDLVHYGGKENFSITVDADTFERQGDVRYTNNGDHQVIHDGDTTLWIGCHCWRQAFTTDPPRNPFDPTADAVDVRAVFGIDKATGDIYPITFDVGGSAGAWAIEEDPYGHLWVAGEFTRGGNRLIHGIARFSEAIGTDAAVTACTATHNGNQVLVEWENVADPDAFVVRRSVNGGTTYWRGRLAGDTSSFVDTDRVGTIVYSVESRVGTGILGSAVICDRVDEAGDPPTGLVAPRVTKERVVLHWTNTGRAVEISRDGQVIATDSDSWFTDLNLTSATTYEYRVRYVGEQTWSAPLTITTL